jgi:hypothetical protein
MSNARINGIIMPPKIIDRLSLFSANFYPLPLFYIMAYL